MGKMEMICTIIKCLSKFLPGHSRKLDNKLISACRNRRVDEVKSLLEEGADVNAWDAEKNTPLIIVSSKYNSHRPLDDDSFRIVELLLGYGLEREGARRIRINEQNYKGNTALMMASRNNAKRIVKTLCNTRGIDLNMKNGKGYTALMRAKKHGFSEIVRILLDHGAQE